MSIMPKNALAKSLGFGLLTFALLAGGFLLPACSAQEGSAEGAGGGDTAGDAEVLATMNGEEITLGDVREQIGAQLEAVEAQLVQCKANYERSRFQTLEGGVQQVIENQLLEAEAAKRGISKEDLLAAEVDATIETVTDEEAKAWFDENQARLRGSYDQLAPRIKDFLGNQRKQEAHDDFIDSLKKDVEVAYRLDPPRSEVAATGPAKGPENAPVTIVEFSDFECPYCARVVPTLEQITEEYGDKVRLVFRHFPLGMHPNAPKAAEASMCAADQGKFWEMHDLMFEEQQQLSVADLKAKAERLELDTEQFNECLDSGKYEDEVQADMQAGQRAGVTGTPAMFVNGRLVSGAVPFDQVAEVIDSELSRAGGDSGASSGE